MRMRALFPGGPQVGEIGLSLSSPPSASQPVRRLAVLAPLSEDPAASGEDGAAQTIRRALEMGVNLIDTDWITANGHAQEMLGRALQGIERERVIITSKAGPRLTFHGELTIDNSRANLINQCHDSLFRLKTDHIDLYQVHWPDDTSPAQTARGLQDIVSGNYASWVGACNYTVAQLEALHGQIKLQTVQAPLNPLNRAALAQMLPWCVEHGVGFLAADPLLSGLLTGRFTGDEQFTEEDSDEFFTPPKFAKAVEFARKLAEIGHPGRLALGWVLAQPGVSCVLCPAVEAAEFETLAGAGALDPATVQAVNQLAQDLGL
jgi:aryl-alcohol dehydrogenase-like predicted oxidoreductase